MCSPTGYWLLTTDYLGFCDFNDLNGFNDLNDR